jgi:hypothetical protein
MKFGTRVEIIGLTIRTELNGIISFVTSDNIVKGRFQVAFFPKLLMIKESNLRVIEDSQVIDWSVVTSGKFLEHLLVDSPLGCCPSGEEFLVKTSKLLTNTLTIHPFVKDVWRDALLFNTSTHNLHFCYCSQIGLYMILETYQGYGRIFQHTKRNLKDNENPRFLKTGFTASEWSCSDNCADWSSDMKQIHKLYGTGIILSPVKLANFVDKVFLLQDTTLNICNMLVTALETHGICNMDSEDFNVKYILNDNNNTILMQWSKYFIDNPQFISVTYLSDAMVLKSLSGYDRTPFEMKFSDEIIKKFFTYRREVMGLGHMTAIAVMEMFYMHNWFHIWKNKGTSLSGWTIHALTIYK